LKYFIGIDLNRWYEVKRGEYDADVMVNTRIHNNPQYAEYGFVMVCPTKTV